LDRAAQSMTPFRAIAARFHQSTATVPSVSSPADDHLVGQSPTLVVASPASTDDVEDWAASSDSWVSAMPPVDTGHAPNVNRDAHASSPSGAGATETTITRSPSTSIVSSASAAAAGEGTPSDEPTKATNEAAEWMEITNFATDTEHIPSTTADGNQSVSQTMLVSTMAANTFAQDDDYAPTAGTSDAGAAATSIYRRGPLLPPPPQSNVSFPPVPRRLRLESNGALSAAVAMESAHGASMASPRPAAAAQLGLSPAISSAASSPAPTSPAL
jgi:hypothetical protein